MIHKRSFKMSDQESKENCYAYGCHLLIARNMDKCISGTMVLFTYICCLSKCLFLCFPRHQPSSGYIVMTDTFERVYDRYLWAGLWQILLSGLFSLNHQLYAVDTQLQKNLHVVNINTTRVNLELCCSNQSLVLLNTAAARFWRDRADMARLAIKSKAADAAETSRFNSVQLPLSQQLWSGIMKSVWITN